MNHTAQDLPQRAWIARRHLRLWGLLLLCISLLGCGFHLRGNSPQERLSGRYFITERGAPEVGSALKRQLQGQSRLAASGDLADVSATLSQESFTRNVVAVDAAGRATAYELRYSVNLRIQAGGPERAGQAEDKPDILTVVREHAYDETDALGNQDEAELYRAEMRNELVRNVLLRLALAQG